MWPFRAYTGRNLRSEQPYWLMRNGIDDANLSLAESVDCDVAIVGAGITGALVSHTLARDGRRVVVVDQRDQALGSTSASTALLQYEIDTDLVDLVPLLGWEDASLAYQAGVASIDLLERLADSLPTQVNFQRRESVYLASSEKDVAKLERELAARQQAGIDVRWVAAAELRSRFNCQRPGAVLSSAGAQLDPFRLARTLLLQATGRSARMFAGTRVTQIEDNDSGVRLRTAAGHSITAAHAVVCCGYESLQFIPYKVADLLSTFALVTEPVTEAHAVDSALLWETSRPYLYLRGTPDHRIVVGGQDMPFRNAAARDLALPHKVEKLKKQYQSLFEQAMPPVGYSWAGTFAETPDGLPYIGHAPDTHARLLFALCFGGNGITYSAHAGPILKAAIDAEHHPLAKVFGFERRQHKPC